jgi:hypothetical protein
MLNVEDIKGSSTYAAVADSLGIELERLYRELKLDVNKVPLGTMLKDAGKLAGVDGFEAASVHGRKEASTTIEVVPSATEAGKSAPAAASAPPNAAGHC